MVGVAAWSRDGGFQMVHRTPSGMHSFGFAGDSGVTVGIDGTAADGAGYPDWRLWCTARGQTTVIARADPGAPPGDVARPLVKNGVVFWQAVVVRAGEPHLDSFAQAGCSGERTRMKDTMGIRPLTAGSIASQPKDLGTSRESNVVLLDEQGAKVALLQQTRTREFHGNDATYLWAESTPDRNRLTAVDWRTGAQQVVYSGRPERFSPPGLIEAGDRVFVFREGLEKPIVGGAILYDPVEHALVGLAPQRRYTADVHAAGDFVLWLDQLRDESLPSLIGNADFKLAKLGAGPVEPSGPLRARTGFPVDAQTAAS
jgi:hypothetical protein